MASALKRAEARMLKESNLAQIRSMIAAGLMTPGDAAAFTLTIDRTSSVRGQTELQQTLGTVQTTAETALAAQVLSAARRH